MDILRLMMLFDAHLHLRIEQMMETVVRLIAPYCQAGVVEPNTGNIRTAKGAVRHRDEIKAAAARAGYPNFRPLMTIMLTDETDPADVEHWPESDVAAGKYYPAELYPHGGVSDVRKIGPVVREMEQARIPFDGHFEKAGVHPLKAELPALPDFRYLADNFPDLPISFEHVSTAKAIEAVREYGPNVVATITPQGLWLTKKDVFNQDGVVIKPHNWCRPPAKEPWDLEALRVAAMSGNRKFLLGSDLAPWRECDKEGENPFAGVTNYPVVLPLLVTLFEQYGRLAQLEAFTSLNAARFYGIKLRNETITLVKKLFTVPESIPLFGTDGSDPTKRIKPWLAGEKFPWSPLKAA